MKIRFMKSLAVVIAMVAGSSAFGQDYFEGCDSDVETVSFLGGDSCQKGCDDDCGKGCGDGCGKGGCGVLDGMGCDAGGLYVDAEALFFRANPGNGAPSPEFDHEIAPRISVGYVGPGGLGIRFRYFDYSHTAGVDLNALGVGDRNILVDTYNMDVEFFEKIDVGCLTSIEWSAGVRYNDFKYRDIEVRDFDGPFVDAYREQFSGWGLTFGLQVDRCLGPGNIYARARWAILRDDNSTKENDFGDPGAIAFGNPDVAIDDVRMQTEIALGYEVSRCTNFGVVTARIGYEIQFWDSYTEFFPDAQIGSPSTESNFGFDGLVLGLELAR